MGEILKIILGSILWILIFPILFIFYLYFNVVKIFAKIRRLELTTLSLPPLASPSSPNQGTILVTAIKLESKIDIEELKVKFITEVFSKHPIFNEEIITFFGHFFTKKVETINLNRHIRTIKRGNNISDNELLTMVGNDNSLFEGGGLPPWELLVVDDNCENNFDKNGENSEKSGNGTFVILKVHHAIMDGYSILHLVDKLTDNKSPYLVDKFEWDISFFRMVRISFFTNES